MKLSSLKMPIIVPGPLKDFTQKEFAQIDYCVMRCAFDSQKQLGRLCDEPIYQNELARQLESIGLGEVAKQVPIRVTHGDFSKTYRLDLVVASGVIYELKAENKLTADDESQLLNYLFLCNVHHGKLVNFRPAKVESRFVNTNLTFDARRNFAVDFHRWQEHDEATRLLRITMLEILDDWGGFLALSLYSEALIYFLGGEQKVSQLLPLNSGGVFLGNQRFHLVSPAMAFRLTALTDCFDYEAQLRALLSHSPLKAIHWINIARHKVHFVTVTK